MTDMDYMRRAIELARLGMGWTNPNPMVGAVIVKDGRIIGEGFHRKCGELHAERNAFKNLTESAEGATIYVTLEPCCHYGKQPPCTEAVIENGIKKVVIGSRDPNPLVSGKGARLLREKGIEVVEDFLREECDALNPVFFHYITTKRPYVVMKYAMTLDGKIATKTGASKWITGSKAREFVHIERSHYAAILAGIGTVLSDDPMLNARIAEKEEIKEFPESTAVTEILPVHQPLRVIVDSKLRIPLESNIVKSAGEYKTVVACGTVNPDEQISEKKRLLEEEGITVLELPDENGLTDLKRLIEWLADNKYDSVYVEGGGTLHEAMLRNNLVNHVSAYVAPKLFGGKDAKSPVEGPGIAEVSQATLLELVDVSRLGDDILLSYDVKGQD